MFGLIKGCRNIASLLLKGELRRLAHTSGNVFPRSSLVCDVRSKHFTIPLSLLSANNHSILEEPSKVQKNDVIDRPLINLIIEENPRMLIVDYIDKVNVINSISEPGKVIEKEAAQLIVTRRRKMKRHKLKKLRVKMKFEWAKVRQKREYKKEKEFQAELMGRIKEAEKFDARAYVEEKIRKANEELVPVLWKGKRLPQFIIKDLLVKQQKRKEELLANRKRREAMNLNVSDYKF